MRRRFNYAVVWLTLPWRSRIEPRGDKRQRALRIQPVLYFLAKAGEAHRQGGMLRTLRVFPRQHSFTPQVAAGRILTLPVQFRVKAVRD